LLAAGPEGAVTDDRAGQAGENIAAEAGAAGQQSALPPGQYIPRTLPVLHYGPVPAFNSQTWDLRIVGATESGNEVKLRWDDVAAMPASQVMADFHCVTKFTVLGLRWAGVPAPSSCAASPRMPP
jgi:DMSO/TMAO reductase YedYZ molybdopterin-dependent catalytic subunit